MKENELYNKIIERQVKEYVKTKRQIQNKVNDLLVSCNTHWLIGTELDINKKLHQLGENNLIGVGGAGVIFKAKRNKFENGMLIVDVLKQRNLRLNLYGGLYYELGNYEYCIGLTQVREILQSMGIKYTILEDDVFKFDKCYSIDPDFFNYVIDLYNYRNGIY